MKDSITQYHDFIMSNEERDNYIDPEIMMNYEDKQALQRIKSRVQIAFSKISYWTAQGSEALAFVVIGGLISTGFLTVVSKLAHFTI